MNEKFPTLHVVNHPLVQHKLTVMRDKNTSVKDFRTLVGEIAMLLTYEATRDLPTTLKTIETPLCTCEMPVLAGKRWPSFLSSVQVWALRTASSI